jgi:oligopeptide/dipeptide ABC transporter ATP-binding protein
MYLGKIVETADKSELYHNPAHPYTKALLSAVPIPDPTRKRSRIILKGDIPSPVNPPDGCRFHTRCHNMAEICKTQAPAVKDIGNGHQVACHLYN